MRGPPHTPKPCSCNIAQTRYSLANRTAIVPLLATEPISEDRQITLTQLIALRGLRSRGELSHPCSMTVGDQVTVKFFAAARAAAGCGSGGGGPRIAGTSHRGPACRLSCSHSGDPRCSFLVDGLSTQKHEGGPLIGAGSRVDVLPPFAGG